MAKARATNEFWASFFNGASATLGQSHQQRQVFVSLPALYPSLSVISNTGLWRRAEQTSDSSLIVFPPSLTSSLESELKNLLSQFAPLPSEHVCEPEQKDCLASLEQKTEQKRKKVVGKVRLRVANASLKRLLSGAFAGAVSRTAVAPLETIRTHLMVGSGGKSVFEVFCHIMQNEGWQGLFRGNGINVIRVAPSKAIE